MRFRSTPALACLFAEALPTNHGRQSSIQEKQIGDRFFHSVAIAPASSLLIFRAHGLRSESDGQLFQSAAKSEWHLTVVVLDHWRSRICAQHRHILAVLQRTGWRIKGPGGAAELLSMKPSTLYTAMQRLGIPTKDGKDGIRS